MGTEIFKSFGTLQNELEQAQNYLKNVDENIKKLIGRDPSEIAPRFALKRPPPNNSYTDGAFDDTNAGGVWTPPAKRRNLSVFKRLSDRVAQDEISPNKMISKVIVSPREPPSRQEALDAQHMDEKSKARNRRMFGALLGTLQKFQLEETKLKKRGEKRAKLERKIEEHEIQEREEIKRERQELFLSRKRKQCEIKIIELKMLRLKELASWEHSQKPLANYIMTKAEPPIYYVPKKLNDASKSLLEVSRTNIESTIEKKKEQLCEEMHLIEDKMRRSFEGKTREIDAKENTTHPDGRKCYDDEEDEDEEEKYNTMTEEVHNECNTPAVLRLEGEPADVSPKQETDAKEESTPQLEQSISTESNDPPTQNESECVPSQLTESDTNTMNKSP